MKNVENRTLTSAAPDVLGRLPERRQVVHAPRRHLGHRRDRDLGDDDDLISLVVDPSAFAFAAAAAVAALALLDDDRRLHHLDLLVLGVEGRVVVGHVAGGGAVLRVEVREVAHDGELLRF